ncbi:MAG TPA: PGF-CTERM sorting domain-containing protein [Candidatus Poseidoniales archaeon]|nr:PGF-CTERM sorting domain-containing protein [Candidatus Poseidoniales archaeon]
MQKNAVLLVMLALVSATMAGCTGTETDTSVSSSSGSGGTTNQTGNQTSNETSGNGTSAPAVLTPMTAEQVLAFMASGEDGDLPEPSEAVTKHGMIMTISGTIDLGMGDPMEDTTITITQMEDSTAQRVMNGMIMSMMGGMMSIQMTTIQGASTGTGEGVVNIIMSDMGDDGTPTGDTKRYYAFDHDWDYESAIESVIDEGSDCPFDEEMDGNPCSATECDWDLDIDEQSQACSSKVENYCGSLNFSYDPACSTNDEGSSMGDDPDFGFPEPDSEMLNSTNWTTTGIDESSGTQSFSGEVDMGDEGGMTNITLTIIPSNPPVMKSMVMDNGSMRMTIEMLMGDGISIDLVDSETTGWTKGSTDANFGWSEPCKWDDCSDGATIEGWIAEADDIIEVPTSQVQLHILTPSETDDDGNDLPQTVLGNFSLVESDSPVTWTDPDGAVWTMVWNDEDNDGLISIDDTLNMTTADNTNASFEFKLYDTWAEDYAGSMEMPGFTAALSFIAMLGACLLLRRREL